MFKRNSRQNYWLVLSRLLSMDGLLASMNFWLNLFVGFWNRIRLK